MSKSRAGKQSLVQAINLEGPWRTTDDGHVWGLDILSGQRKKGKYGGKKELKCHLSFCIFTIARISSCTSIASRVLLRTSSFVTWYL